MSPHPLAGLAALVPHRYPMALIDRLEALVPGRHGSAWKAVSANEARDAGTRGLPPTLLVDALGQLAIAVLESAFGVPEPASLPRTYYLAEIEGMEFADPARPGDLLRMEAKVKRTLGRTSRVDVQAEVDGRRVAWGAMVLSRADATPRPERGGRSN